MEATAKANTNIALIKYWGKRDETLFLPMNNNLSITLDTFYTITTAHFCDYLSKDVFILNNNLASEGETDKITRFLDHVRKLAGTDLRAMIRSTNKVPTAAGLASSASGYAALAAAAVKALNLNLDNKKLSQIARLGSGSACRSIYGGYVEWQKGEREDGDDSFANPLLPADEWNISILSVLVEPGPKMVSSRDGMKRTVETSAFYSGWLDTVEKDFVLAKEAIKSHDFEMLGKVVEANALKMHATTLGSDPPFMYWKSETLEVMQKVYELRSSGIPAYFTIDAGPNVKVLCLPKDEEQVRDVLLQLQAVKNVHTCHPGEGITYLPNGLNKAGYGI